MATTKETIAVREITFRRICDLAVAHLNYQDVKEQMMDALGIQVSCPEEKEARDKFRKEFHEFVQQMADNGRFRTIRVLWDEDN